MFFGISAESDEDRHPRALRVRDRRPKLHSRTTFLECIEVEEDLNIYSVRLDGRLSLLRIQFEKYHLEISRLPVWKDVDPSIHFGHMKAVDVLEHSGRFMNVIALITMICCPHRPCRIILAEDGQHESGRLIPQIPHISQV